MKTTEGLRPGDKVTHVAPHGAARIGVVKSVPDAESAFVVYACGGEWENYADYTAARTKAEELEHGWRAE